jgi:hypothetical protein
MDIKFGLIAFTKNSLISERKKPNLVQRLHTKTQPKQGEKFSIQYKEGQSKLAFLKTSA